jgi:hypothetical protein
MIFELLARHVGPLFDEHHQLDHATPPTSAGFCTRAIMKPLSAARDKSHGYIESV